MIEQDGIRWVEIGQAARLSRTKATIIGEAIAAGAIPSLVVDGKTWVPLTAANRLKRETAAMRSIERKIRCRRHASVRRSTGADLGASRKANRAAYVERSPRPRLDWLAKSRSYLEQP